MKIEQRKIDEIIPCENNPRQNDQAIEAVQRATNQTMRSARAAMLATTSPLLAPVAFFTPEATTGVIRDRPALWPTARVWVSGMVPSRRSSTVTHAGAVVIGSTVYF